MEIVLALQTPCKRISGTSRGSWTTLLRICHLSQYSLVKDCLNYVNTVKNCAAFKNDSSKAQFTDMEGWPQIGCMK